MLSGKNDLSHSQTKVDFDLLIKMTRESVMSARILFEREMNKFQLDCFANDLNKMANGAQSLNEFSGVLARACETLHLLEESKKRADLVFVNRGENLIS